MDAVLPVALPRLADRHEAASPIAEAGLQRAAEGADAEIARRVRVAVLKDAHVVVAVAVFDACQGVEQVRQALRSLEMADGCGRRSVDGVDARGGDRSGLGYGGRRRRVALHGRRDRQDRRWHGGSCGGAIARGERGHGGSDEQRAAHGNEGSWHGGASGRNFPRAASGMRATVALPSCWTSWASGARVVFAGAWIALQASLVLSAAWRPDGAFGFRMFPEASTIEVHLERDVGGTFVPVTSGGWSARDAAGQLRHFAWRDRVRDPVLSRLDVRAFAAYGADAQLARLQRARSSTCRTTSPRTPRHGGCAPWYASSGTAARRPRR